MENLWKDVQYGARMLLKNKGFTAVAVLSLALGIGVNSTIFSLVNAVLLRPMPVSNPHQLMEVYSSVEQFPYSVSSYPDFLDLRDQNDVFSGMVAHSMMGALLTHEGRSDLILGEIVTGNYFDVLGVAAAHGRVFLPEENETPGTHPVVVVSHGYWQRRFGANPSMLGSTIRINGRSYSVVGIAPETFTGTIPGFSPELWIPMMMAEEIEPMGIQDRENSPTGDTRLEQRGTRWLFVKGRLKPNTTIEQAEAQLATIVKRLEQEHPISNEGRSIKLLPSENVRFHPMVDSALSPAALLILAVVGMVLLIACANVANMLLARASARKQEIAVRLALGASRGRLLRQLFTESLLLAGASGIIGLLFAYWTANLLLAFQPPGNVSITLNLGLDARVFLFTLVVSMLAALVFGLAPALRASRPDLVPSLRSETVRGDKCERRFGLRNLLVVGQIAVSLVLLVGAGLLIRSLQNARGMDLGFDADRLAVMQVDLNLHGYAEEEGEVFFRRLLERIRNLPEVTSATLTSRLPLTTNITATGIYIEGHQQTPDDQPFIVDRTMVGTNYFRTMGVPLIRGRDFTEVDTEDSPAVAIVNQNLANLYWPDEDPIGKTFHTDGLDGPTTEIVGVCGDYKVRTVGEEPRPYVHFARSQQSSTNANLLVRTSGDPATAVGNLRQEMLSMDPDLIFLEADTMPNVTAIALLPVRMGAVLVGVFGLLGMVLAAVGLYGVITYSVSRRTHEIGLRLALGAETSNVLGMVVKQGMVVALVGVLLGLAGAAAVSRVLSSVLYDVNPIDPLSFGAASLLLLGVALIANFIPAQRAARVDPVTALRYE